MSHNQTLRVFEHDRLVVGHAYESVSGTPLEFSAAHFEALARYNDQHDQRFFRLGHRSVRFTQYVGLIQVGYLAIEVLPKTDAYAKDKALWRDALLKMLAVSGQLRLHSFRMSDLGKHRGSLFDLYVDMFLSETERLVHEGLARRYRTVEGNSSTFRGRLLVAQHLRRNLIHAERFYVAHQVYDPNHLLNRGLCAALEVLAEQPGLASHARRIQGVRELFPETTPGWVNPDLLAQLRLDRKTLRYSVARELSCLILRNHCPDLRRGKHHLVALLFDMNRLFEAFVTAMARRAAPPGVRVRSQKAYPLWSAGTGKRWRSVRPDLVVAGPTGRLVIDTKWKVPANGRPASGDLQQMFVYNELLGSTQGLLLYPQAHVAQTGTGPQTFRDRDHACGTAYLEFFRDGAFDLTFIKEQLRALVAACANPVHEGRLL